MEELGRRFDGGASPTSRSSSRRTPSTSKATSRSSRPANVGEWETDRATAAALLDAPTCRSSASRTAATDAATAEFPLDWGTEIPLELPSRAEGRRRLRRRATGRSRSTSGSARRSPRCPGRVALIASADHGHAHDAGRPLRLPPGGRRVRRAAAGDPRLGPPRLPPARRARRAREGGLALAAPRAPGRGRRVGARRRARVRGADVLRDARRGGSDGGVEPPLARHALELVDAAVLELEPRAGDEILDRARDEHLARAGMGGDPRAGVDGDPGRPCRPTSSHSPVCSPERTSMPELAHAVDDRLRAADGPRRARRTQRRSRRRPCPPRGRARARARAARARGGCSSSSRQPASPSFAMCAVESTMSVKRRVASWRSGSRSASASHAAWRNRWIDVQHSGHLGRRRDVTVDRQLDELGPRDPAGQVPAESRRSTQRSSVLCSTSVGTRIAGSTCRMSICMFIRLRDTKRARAGALADQASERRDLLGACARHARACDSRRRIGTLTPSRSLLDHPQRLSFRRPPRVVGCAKLAGGAAVENERPRSLRVGRGEEGAHGDALGPADIAARSDPPRPLPLGRRPSASRASAHRRRGRTYLCLACRSGSVGRRRRCLHAATPHSRDIPAELDVRTVGGTNTTSNGPSPTTW